MLLIDMSLLFLKIKLIDNNTFLKLFKNWKIADRKRKRTDVCVKRAAF